MVDVILGSAASIAREWHVLAIVWHAAALCWLAAIFTRRATTRGAAVWLALPLFSVAAMAWWSGNPFNTILPALAGALLLRVAMQLPSDRLRPVRGMELAAGLALCLFGWSYPHFLDAAGWRYLYEAPLGLLPCPTLAFLIGASLVAGSFDSRAWIAVLAPLGAIYGVIGVFVLGVTIDWVLIAGAALLSAHRAEAHDSGPAHLFRHRRIV